MFAGGLLAPSRVLMIFTGQPAAKHTADALEEMEERVASSRTEREVQTL